MGQRIPRKPPPSLASLMLYLTYFYLKSDNLTHRSHQGAAFGAEKNSSQSSFWNGAKDGMKMKFRSGLRRRCKNYLGCSSHSGGVEIFNGIFMNNVLWLKDVDKESIMQIEALQDFYAGANYLPAALAKPGVWTPGPKIVTFKDGDKDVPTVCAKVWDTDGFFCIRGSRTMPTTH